MEKRDRFPPLAGRKVKWPPILPRVMRSMRRHQAEGGGLPDRVAGREARLYRLDLLRYPQQDLNLQPTVSKTGALSN